MESEWRSRSGDGRYAPAAFTREGFVHAAGDRAVAEEVASAYFAKATEPVIYLEIAVDGLDVRWEAPAPPTGTPQKHHAAGRLFPHVYEPIPLRAIVAQGTLEKTADGWRWLPAGS